MTSDDEIARGVEFMLAYTGVGVAWNCMVRNKLERG